MIKIKNFGHLLLKSAQEFINDNALKLGASLSYYTIFSIPPLLLIIIAVSGIFFGPDAVKGEIYGQIKGFIGSDAAIQVQDMIKNVSLSKNTTMATIIGVITLILGASGVFMEIQDSINFIWGLKSKPKKGLIKMLRNRLMSFSMIVSMGFLLIVSLTVNAVMDAINSRLQSHFPGIAVQVFYVANILFLVVIITLLFMTVFHTLPDGKVAWKDSFWGALFTAVLFMIGKSGIGFYLSKSMVLSTYGAAGSLIIILLWVYYSALILYFGAEFTKVYAYTYGGKITPNAYAVHIEKHEVESTAKKITEPVAKLD